MHTNTIEPLAWDSDFLGFGVGRVSLESPAAGLLETLLTQARHAGLRLLYLTVSPGDLAGNAAALEAGAALVDRKTTFAMPVAAAEARAVLPAAIHSASVPVPGLAQLALQSGEYSRFRLDSNFAPGTYERLYRQWLRNSLGRTLAREVVVYQTAPTAPALGLLTLGVKPNRADIGLLAVAAGSRRLGVGRQLVAAARQLTAAWGLPALQVVTQLDNQPACAFYLRMGFAVQQVEHIYHLWLTP